MKAKEIKFTGANGVSLPGIIWYPLCSPTMVVQITHGMTEHIGRYEQLAEYLTSYGIAVAGFDLRGHGHNPGDNQCASFGEGGWNYALHDIQLLNEMGYEFKDGKQKAFRGKDQKRFIRLRSLGEGYSEDELIAVISGKSLHKAKNTSKHVHPQKRFSMLIDIEQALADGKSKGYTHWAKKFNRKELAKIYLFLKESGLDNYEDLVAHVEKLETRFDELSDSIKAAEKRINDIHVLQTHMNNYSNTRDVYVEYRKSGYSKKFFEEHREEIQLHKAAKDAFNQLGVKKLPTRKQLSIEFNELLIAKKKAYAEYRQVRDDIKELQIAKKAMDVILGKDRQQEEEKKKRKER